MNAPGEDIGERLERILDAVDSDGSAWGGWDGRGLSTPEGAVKGGELVPAGVLVPVIKERDGSVSVLFTQRTMKVKDHKGQVSFPGGVEEEGDGSLLETALRETMEEIGLGREKVGVKGRLRPYDTITGYRVHPFVGVIEGRPEVTVSDDEIEHVFFVGLDTLMDEATFRQTRIEWDGRVHEVRAYEWGGPVIWGATANILSELIERLRS
ncbi:MAG: CoA pyrophosphatase [Deltaproteobacteria bacterium]|nr:CoA pyrophosphatase [Deltaproteobacteria bacterium]